MSLSTCHPERLMQARGLCKPCYDKWLKANNPGYKERQKSNTTAWSKLHPEKRREYSAKSIAKKKLDPNYDFKNRDRALRRQYGISVQEYEQILAAQGGGCAICERKQGARKLHVDHCHKTGRVRGVLCHQCNWYFGTIDRGKNIISSQAGYKSLSPEVYRRSLELERSHLSPSNLMWESYQEDSDG